jgi:hypothetical protein
LIQQNAAGVRNLEFVSGVAQVATLDFSSVAQAGVPLIDALAFKAGSHRASVNGSAVLTNAYAGVPNLSLFELGKTTTDDLPAGLIQWVQCSGEAMNDANLQRAALGLVA